MNHRNRSPTHFANNQAQTNGRLHSLLVLHVIYFWTAIPTGLQYQFGYNVYRAIMFTGLYGILVDSMAYWSPVWPNVSVAYEWLTGGPNVLLAGWVLASFPSVQIWRRGEEERLVHTVVCMHLISIQLLCKRQKMTMSNGSGFIDDVCQWTWHTE